MAVILYLHMSHTATIAMATHNYTTIVGYADTPILCACAAYAAILGGKSAQVARLSPVASHVRKYSDTGNWI